MAPCQQLVLRSTPDPAGAPTSALSRIQSGSSSGVGGFATERWLPAISRIGPFSHLQHSTNVDRTNVVLNAASPKVWMARSGLLSDPHIKGELNPVVDQMDTVVNE